VLIREYQTLWSFRDFVGALRNGMQMECKPVFGSASPRVSIIEQGHSHHRQLAGPGKRAPTRATTVLGRV
jgi:hypothetical protein